MTSASLPSPRDRARAVFGRSIGSLATWCAWRTLFEIACMGLTLLWDPGRVPVPLLALCAATRAGFDLRAAQLTWRMVPLARAHRIDWQIAAAGTFFVMAALVALVPRFDVVPESMSEPAWDALMGFGELVFVVTALGAATDFARRVARIEGLAPTSSALGLALLALIPVPLAGLGAVDSGLGPTPWLGLGPTPWLGLGAALVVAWGFVVAKHLRWERAVAITLVVLAAGRLTTLGEDPRPLIAAGAAIVLALAAWAVREPLFDLAGHVAAPTLTGPSRSTIRRLFEGPASERGTRGGRPANAGSGSADDSLLMAYHELGLEPKPAAKARGTPENPPAELPPLPDNMAPLVPRSRSESTADAPAPDAADAPTSPRRAPLDPASPADDAAWTNAARGLRWLKGGMLARALLIVFGYLLGNGPLGTRSEFWLALGLLATLTGAAHALGLGLVARLPEAARARRPARVAALTAALATASDLALAFTWQPATVLVAATLSAAVTLTILAMLHRLFADVAHPNGRARVVAATWLFLATTTLAVGVAAIGQLAVGDLQWLAGPLGIATSLAAIATWVTLLWLVHDAGIGVEDLRTRVLRAREPLEDRSLILPPDA